MSTNAVRLRRVLRAPPEASDLGWQESLTLLAKLVETEVLE